VTPQEEQLLNALAQRVNSTQLEEKDPDAEAFLNRSFNSNPDALYILAQTVLVQNIALDQAKAQVAQLQGQLQQARQQPAHATSFLGSLLGRRDPQPEPPQPPQSTAPQYAQPVQQPTFQPVQQPQYIPAQQPQQFAPAAQGQPSFLRGAMQTAAGVAAGALAFEGVEAALHGIMGHPAYGYGEPAMGMGMGGFGMGGLGMGGGVDRPVDETVINNYYDQPGGGAEHNEQLSQGNVDQGSGEQHFHESSDQNAGQFSDASYNTSGDDQGNSDNTDYDDSTQDDDSSYDDGGQDDSGGFGDGGDNDFA
jgi:uncharacterized protein